MSIAREYIHRKESCDKCGIPTDVSTFGVDSTSKKYKRLCPKCYELRMNELMGKNPQMISVDLTSDTFTIGKGKKRYQFFKKIK